MEHRLNELWVIEHPGEIRWPAVRPVGPDAKNAALGVRKRRSSGRVNDAPLPFRRYYPDQVQRVVPDGSGTLSRGSPSRKNLRLQLSAGHAACLAGCHPDCIAEWGRRQRRSRVGALLVAAQRPCRGHRQDYKRIFRDINNAGNQALTQGNYEAFGNCRMYEAPHVTPPAECISRWPFIVSR